MSTQKNMKQVVGIVERVKNGKKHSYWTRIGTAFENADGSWNQLLDFYPANPSTTLQLRDIEARETPEE